MPDAPFPDGFTLRPAQESDVREVAELWAASFPGRRTVEDRVRMLETGGRYGGLETVLVLRGPTDALAGAAKIYRLESHIAGVAFPMMGLAAVAVAPSHRRRGLGARICADAVRVAAERGDVLSVLYPFRPEFYERLGWGLVGELHDYRFETAALPLYEEVRHVRAATGQADGEAMAACYARVAGRSNGPITRDRRVWAYRLAAEELGVLPLDHDADAWSAPPADPKLRAVVFDDDGVAGYALLRYVTRRDRDEERLEIRELVTETELAYRGLIGFVASRSDRWPLGRHFARPEERFGDRLSEPRPPGHPAARSLYFRTARIVRGPMLRILDMYAALRDRPWFDADGGLGRAATLRITVRDRQRPENDGPWTVRLDGQGGGEVEKGPGTATDDPPDTMTADCDAAVSADAATFARIFAGEISPADAARLGRASLHGDTHLADRAFATRERFWLLDEF